MDEDYSFEEYEVLHKLDQAFGDEDGEPKRVRFTRQEKEILMGMLWRFARKLVEKKIFPCPQEGCMGFARKEIAGVLPVITAVFRCPLCQYTEVAPLYEPPKYPCQK